MFTGAESNKEHSAATSGLQSPRALKSGRQLRDIWRVRMTREIPANDQRTKLVTDLLSDGQDALHRMGLDEYNGRAETKGQGRIRVSQRLRDRARDCSGGKEITDRASLAVGHPISRIWRSLQASSTGRAKATHGSISHLRGRVDYGRRSIGLFCQAPL
jgi:hypothetical protein